MSVKVHCSFRETFKKKQRKAAFSIRELPTLLLPLRCDDESISVYLKDVFNILLA